MKKPIWILEDSVLAIHMEQIAEHGGEPGIRDYGLLSSALNRPKNKYSYSETNPTLAMLAASYAHGIIKNHPFIDGNKRVAFVVCLLFLNLNGFNITAPPLESYKAFMGLAEGGISEKIFSDWIDKNISKIKIQRSSLHIS